MKPILKFEHVTKHYPNGVHALKDISFTVSEGEFISIIGPSGYITLVELLIKRNTRNILLIVDS